MFSEFEIFEVVIIDEYFTGVNSELQPVSLILQCQLDGQQLSVAYVVVSLCWGQLSGKQHTGMQLPTPPLVLGKHNRHYSHSNMKLGCCRTGEEQKRSLRHQSARKRWSSFSPVGVPNGLHLLLIHTYAPKVDLECALVEFTFLTFNKYLLVIQRCSSTL